MLNKLYEIQEKVDFKNQVLAGLKIEQFLESVDDYETGWAYYGVDFVHTANTRYFGIRELGSQNQEFYIERLSIREYNIGTGVMTNMSVDDLEGDTP